MKTIVLVTAIGTVTATSIVKELKKTGEYHIIGADINQRDEIATSLDTDEFYVFPPVAEKNDYLKFVLEFCVVHKVEYYFAVLDTEVITISKNREEFKKIGTKLCVVNYDFANICHYKNLFIDWVKEHMPQIAIRTYKSIKEISSDEYPVFIKPVEGLASKGCRKIENVTELESVVLPTQVNTKVLIQEYVTGENISVDLIRNKKTGQKIQIQRKELLRNANGCGIAVEIINDPVLTEICDTLMEELDLNGVANAEFLLADEIYKIIEINPRFSAGSVYSCMAGINTITNAMYIVDGKECIFHPIKTGSHFAERYEAYRMN